MMSDFTAIDRLPNTIFVGGPTDKLEKTDPTKISDVVKPINNYKRNLIDGLDELKVSIPSLTNLDSLSGNLKTSLSSLNDKLNLSKTFDKIPGLSEDIKRNALNASSFDTGLDTVISIGGSMFNVSSQNLDMVYGLKDIYDVITDPGFVRNLKDNIKNSLIGTAIDIAGGFGFGELAELLVDEVTSPKYKRQVWGQVAYSYTSSSDLDTILKSLRNGGMAGLYGFTDDPVGYLLSSFRLDSNKYKTIDENMSKLLEVLSLMDSNWDHYLRGTEKVYKLDPFRKCSQDALMGFDSMNEYRPIARASKELKEDSSRSVMGNTYPILKEMMKDNFVTRY